MRVISFVNLKGGVAKTTTTINMAAILATEYGKRVLVIDADSQYNLSLHLGADTDAGTLCNVLGGDEPYYENLVQHTYLRNVDIIPGSLDLMSYDLRALQEHTVNSACIRDLCTVLIEDDAYDFVLIDCPPAFSASCAAAVYASDEVIVPTTIGRYEEEGVKNLWRQISGLRTINQGLRIAGVLATRVRNDELTLQGVQQLRKDFSDHLFATMIRQTPKVGESAYYAQSVITWSPTSAATKDYRAFVAEYLERSESRG